MTRWLCTFLALVAVASVQAGDLTVPSGRSLHRLSIHDAAADHVNYVLYMPSVSRDVQGGLPLILFLHGSEQRGDDPSVLEELPILRFAEMDKGFPFVAIVPQCPRGVRWSPSVLKQLLDAVEAILPIDRDRVYLTGFSMGGFGTWQTAAALPGVFAAIAPLCGPSDLPDAPRLSTLPVWIFHGELDENVPLSESERMVEALRRAGADARLTVYPDLAHDCWDMTYQDSRIYLWFLAHSRTSTSPSSPP
jgi:predicted peptidase